MAAVAALAVLWPVAHLVWVARMDVDPWEFFGWAMYSRPAARVQVRVEVERSAGEPGSQGGAAVPLRAMGALRREIEGFARRRSTLGRHADGEDLRAAVFASDPSIEAVTIVLRDVRLDLDSAHLVGHVESHRTLRSEQPDARSNR